MKSKVILFCVLLFCSSIVDSIPHSEDLVRQRVNPPSNWQVNQNAPNAQYPDTDFTRTQNVNIQQENTQDYYLNQGRNNYDSNGYNRSPISSPSGEEHLASYDSPADGRRLDSYPHRVESYPPRISQVGIDNQQYRNQDWQSQNEYINSAPRAVLIPDDETPLVTTVQEPYRGPVQYLQPKFIPSSNQRFYQPGRSYLTREQLQSLTGDSKYVANSAPHFGSSGPVSYKHFSGNQVAASGIKARPTGGRRYVSFAPQSEIIYNKAPAVIATDTLTDQSKNIEYADSYRSRLDLSNTAPITIYDNSSPVISAETRNDPVPYVSYRDDQAAASEVKIRPIGGRRHTQSVPPQSGIIVATDTLKDQSRNIKYLENYKSRSHLSNVAPITNHDDISPLISEVDNNNSDSIPSNPAYINSKKEAPAVIGKILPEKPLARKYVNNYRSNSGWSNIARVDSSNGSPVVTETVEVKSGKYESDYGPNEPVPVNTYSEASSAPTGIELLNSGINKNEESNVALHGSSSPTPLNSNTPENVYQKLTSGITEFKLKNLVGNPDIQNVLTRSNKRYVVVHSNGTVEYMDKLDLDSHHNSKLRLVHSNHKTIDDSGSNGKLTQLSPDKKSNNIAKTPVPVDEYPLPTNNQPADDEKLTPLHVDQANPADAYVSNPPLKDLSADHGNYKQLPQPEKLPADNNNSKLLPSNVIPPADDDNSLTPIEDQSAQNYNSKPLPQDVNRPGGDRNSRPLSQDGTQSADGENLKLLTSKEDQPAEYDYSKQDQPKDENNFTQLAPNPSQIVNVKKHKHSYVKHPVNENNSKVLSTDKNQPDDDRPFHLYRRQPAYHNRSKHVNQPVVNNNSNPSSPGENQPANYNNSNPSSPNENQPGDDNDFKSLRPNKRQPAHLIKSKYSHVYKPEDENNSNPSSLAKDQPGNDNNFKPLSSNENQSGIGNYSEQLRPNKRQPAHQNNPTHSYVNQLEDDNDSNPSSPDGDQPGNDNNFKPVPSNENQSGDGDNRKPLPSNEEQSGDDNKSKPLPAHATQSANYAKLNPSPGDQSADDNNSNPSSPDENQPGDDNDFKSLRPNKRQPAHLIKSKYSHVYKPEDENNSNPSSLAKDQPGNDNNFKPLSSNENQSGDGDNRKPLPSNEEQSGDDNKSKPLPAHATQSANYAKSNPSPGDQSADDNNSNPSSPDENQSTDDLKSKPTPAIASKNDDQSISTTVFSTVPNYTTSSKPQANSPVVSTTPRPDDALEDEIITLSPIEQATDNVSGVPPVTTTTTTTRPVASKNDDQSISTTVSPTVPNYTTSSKPQDSSPVVSTTPRPDDTLEDEIITLSPIEQATDNVSGVPPVTTTTTTTRPVASKNDDQSISTTVSPTVPNYTTSSKPQDSSPVVSTTPRPDDTLEDEIITLSPIEQATDNVSDIPLVTTTTTTTRPVETPVKSETINDVNNKQDDAQDGTNASSRNSDKAQTYYTTTVSPSSSISPTDNISDDKTIGTIKNKNTPTNEKTLVDQVNNGKKDTAMYNSSELFDTNTDVPAESDNYSSVTASPSVQIDVNTGDAPGDNSLELEQSETDVTITVSSSTPNDSEDEIITINIEVSESTDDADSPSNDKSLVVSINTNDDSDDDYKTPKPEDCKKDHNSDDARGKNVEIDMSNLKGPPTMWIRTTNQDLIDKLTATNDTEFDVVYFFHIDNQPAIEREKTTTIYCNGTVVIETKEITYAHNDDPTPTIVRTTKIMQIEDYEAE